MKSNSTNNARTIYEFTKYLKEAKRLDDSTIDGVLKSVNRFEEYTGYVDFKKFRAKHAIGFKKHLLSKKSIATGKT
ncbi:TPA: hypothetical protein ACX6R4_002973 [Photobacterium damselae]